MEMKVKLTADKYWVEIEEKDFIANYLTIINEIPKITSLKNVKRVELQGYHDNWHNCVYLRVYHNASVQPVYSERLKPDLSELTDRVKEIVDNWKQYDYNGIHWFEIECDEWGYD